MKKFPVSLLCLLVLCLSFVWFPGLTSSAGTVRVTGVIDGDTIIIADGQRIRYLGVDTPERGKDKPGEFLSQEAFEFNRKLVLKKQVRLKYGSEQRDNFGRVLAYVFLDNGVLVNGELVKQGLAKVLYHGPWMEHFGDFLQHQREAIRNRKGIWAKTLSESDNRYRGQIHTRRFHRLECLLGKGIAPPNLIIFRSKKEAYWQGYSPCRTCKP